MSAMDEIQTELGLSDVEADEVDGVRVITKATLDEVSVPADEWHSYRVGEVVDGEVRMYEEPIDDGPVKPITPEEFVRGAAPGEAG